MGVFDDYCWQLRSAVAESGLSRAELAERVGVTPATVKSWVTGRRSPTVRRLLDLTAALDLEVGRLFERPTDLPVQVTCAACGQTFRNRVGHRIHVAIKAKTCDKHAAIAEPAVAQARVLEASAV
jgi:transcriptional regulator with XRE-family HTH domain